jgi:hypothetical protein
MAEVESALDTQRLSSFLDMEAPDLQNIIDSAAEGVVFLLRLVQVKASEYEEISNAKALLEVNYGTSGSWKGCINCVEQVVHTSTLKVMSMNEQLQKYHNETDELKTKLNNIGNNAS